MKKILLVLFLICIGVRLSGMEETASHKDLTNKILNGNLKIGESVVFEDIESEGLVLKSYKLSTANPPRVIEFSWKNQQKSVLFK